MRSHIGEFRLRSMCRVLGVHRSGYYVWLRQSSSAGQLADDRLLGLIKHHWLDSGSVYGYRKVTVDLSESGETCSCHRVHRLMKGDGLRAEVGYGSKPRYRGGPVGVIANVLNREFAPDAPNRGDRHRVHPHLRRLAVSRGSHGSVLAPDRRLGHTRSTMTSDLVLQALLAAVWKRKPGPGVMVHSDQGSQGGFNRSSQHL
ncbi:putative transposase [Paraburkholderia caledonica]|uniref:Transposase n=1 Tax=Paraburkholderia caledonica TaxID=134536 RepID=A0AB73ILR1_9BURK|nr:putative transposase [Paraburkholderia caledonica]